MGERPRSLDRPSEADVREWLLEEGYPLEMWAAAQMRALGFLANQSMYFEDPKTKEHREIDVSAGAEESFALDGKPKGIARWSVYVECKFSRDPWVVFVGDDPMQRFMNDILRPCTQLGQDLVLACGRSMKPPRGFDAEVHGYGMARRPGSVRETQALTDIERRDPAYAAMKKLAAVAMTELDDALPAPNLAAFVYPLLLLDAPLFSARLSGSDELEVRSIRSAVVTAPPVVGGRRMSILVVTRHEFAAAMRRIQQEIELLRNEGRHQLPALSAELAATFRA